MKIVPKLTLALVGGTCAILALNGALRVSRERGYFEADRLRDHELIGRSVGAAASAVWRSDGEQAALHAIDAVNSHFTSVQIRFVEDLGSLSVDPRILAGAPGGQPYTRAVSDPRNGMRWETYVPLDVNGVRRGVIALSEPMTSEQQFVQRTIAETVALTLALAIASAVLSFILGQWLVGAPIRVLSEKARRVGRGDFSGPVVLRRRDELAELAREMNAMSDRLLMTMAQVRHADRLATVGKLASGVAHELGTPLNVVAVRAAMISSGEAPPTETQAYGQIIVGAAERMTKIVRRLLQFARREQAQKSLRDIPELVRESIELLRPLADKQQVHLELASGEGVLRARVDPGQIQQVIANLIVNSIQAMPRGGAATVTLRTGRGMPPVDVGDRDVDYICLSVRDEGEGIASEHLPHIFEPFFTTKDVGEGTGMGLAVTYGIIREHDGWVTAESAVNEGTTVSVFLPVGELG
jgi:two-component system NtrC family sensor kinase